MVGPYAVEQLDSPLSLDVTLVTLEGGLRPPFFLMSLHVGGNHGKPHAVEQLDSPLSLDVTLVILEGGLRPPFF